jgi:hypothetical protein
MVCSCHPPAPDYVSAHSAVCGSSMEILRRTFHFRYATDQGKRLGRKVALRIHRHYFQPTLNSVIRRGTA